MLISRQFATKTSVTSRWPLWHRAEYTRPSFILASCVSQNVPMKIGWLNPARARLLLFNVNHDRQREKNAKQADGHIAQWLKLQGEEPAGGGSNPRPAPGLR